MLLDDNGSTGALVLKVHLVLFLTQVQLVLKVHWRFNWFTGGATGSTGFSTGSTGSQRCTGSIGNSITGSQFKRQFSTR